MFPVKCPYFWWDFDQPCLVTLWEWLTVCYWKWPIETVDLPNLKMVIFHSYVSLPDLGWSRWPAKGSADQLQWDRLSVRLLVQATRGHSGKKFYDLIMIKVRLAMVKFRSVQPPEPEIMGKIIGASKTLWRCVKGSETAQFCTVHGRYFSWIHIAWFLGIQILQHFGMALATSVDTTNSVNRMRKAWKSSDGTPSCWPAPYSMSTATWTQDLRKTAKITKKKGETSATKLGVWNFFQAMGWKVISILQHHQSLVCWAISKLLGKPQDQLGELGTSKIQKSEYIVLFYFWIQKNQKHIEIPRKRAESQT